ncbi:MAG: hypothetical protein OEL78_04085 [Hyphomicrobiales bacterium]|nr:hypothetical protein [Hyphomicrobiales bacterium]
MVDRHVEETDLRGNQTDQEQRFHVPRLGAQHGFETVDGFEGAAGIGKLLRFSQHDISGECTWSIARLDGRLLPCGGERRLERFGHLLRGLSIAVRDSMPHINGAGKRPVSF